MRIKLKLTRTVNAEPEYLYTTLFSIALWEEKFNKKPLDARNSGFRDWSFWAYTLLKVRGEKLPDDFMDWLKENPEMDVLPEADVTNPNPTDAALTDGN